MYHSVEILFFFICPESQYILQIYLILIKPQKLKFALQPRYCQTAIAGNIYCGICSSKIFVPTLS
jgi:hypothetical protein